MSWQEDMVEVERSRAEALAQHVEGPVLVASLVSIGGLTSIGWLRRRIYGGERGLPRADASSSALRERVHQVFGEETEDLPGPAGAASPSERAMVSQSEEFSRLGPAMLARAYPVLESDETIRYRLNEMAPAPLILGPLLVFYAFFWPLFRLARGSRALVVTDQNLYLIRGRGADASVLCNQPLGSARVKPGGSIARGRYLQIADQRFWMLGPPEEVKGQIAAAKGGDL